MVASGRASVFIQRAKETTTIKVAINFYFLIGWVYFICFSFNLGLSQAWDHAVGMICIHEAGGKVRVFLHEKYFRVSVRCVLVSYMISSD